MLHDEQVRKSPLPVMKLFSQTEQYGKENNVLQVVWYKPGTTMETDKT